MEDSNSNFTVAALYHFATMTDIEDLQSKIRKTCDDNNVMGTLLLAHEGINGTIAGSAASVENVLTYLRDLPNLAGLDYKLSWADTAPFPRMKVRLKKEIVTIGLPNVNPNETVGTYVNPEDWNDIISDPDVIVVDTRNDYEYAVGTFRGAIDPETTSFRDFPEYVRSKLDKNKQKKVAMFCTGGIRCEKASSFMLQEGFDEVFHLKGGILKYLETVPKEESLWDGECFVFDQRVTVKHGLEMGSYDMCHACRMPILPKDMEHKHYIQGVSCHHCHDKRSAAQKAAAMEREKQIQLSKARGEAHLGSKSA